MQLYAQLRSFFKELAPTWRKTQVVNLSLLASAIFSHKCLTVAALARSFPIGPTRKVPMPKHGLFHRLKRLRRFLDNSKLDLEAIFVRLTRLSCSVCRSPGMLLPVLLDPTYFGDYTTVVASVPRAGRALPIAWRVFRRNLEGESEDSQNQIIQNLVQEVSRRVLEMIEMVLIADREFASAEFFRFLKKLGRKFAIRVDAETWIIHKDYTGPLGSLPIGRGGKRLWFEGALYSKEHQERVNILAVWEANQKEPWFIATVLDEAKLTERCYRKRMKIEHGFRDWKHHLRLKGTLRVELVERAAMMITAVALLYWFLCLVGIRLDRPEHRADASYWGKSSFFKTALDLLEVGHEAALRAAERVVVWTADKLFGLKPLTPTYKLRYRRFRYAFLRQSGSP